MQEQLNEFHGYALFNEVENPELQTQNRAVTLANIAEDYIDGDGQVNEHGKYLMVCYFDMMPDLYRPQLLSKLKEELEARNLLEVL